MTDGGQRGGGLLLLGGLRVWPLLRGSADMGVSCPPQSSVSSLFSPRPQDCTICMERLVTASGYEGVLRHKGVRPELVGRLGRCGHMYHLLCLVAMYSNGTKVGWRAGGADRRAGEGPRHLGTSQPPPTPRPRMAACSAPPARPSTGRRRALSRPGRWSFTSSLTRCPVSLTPRPSVSSMTSPPASR